MRPTILIVLLATIALASSIASGGEEKTGLGSVTAPKRTGAVIGPRQTRWEASTVPASLPKKQATKIVFATVKVTGEVGADE